MAYLPRQALEQLGFARLGNNVQISDKASIYGHGRIRIGDNVRIDDFCVLSAGTGGIDLGNHVHIAVFCSLIGAAAILLKDFSGLSSRVSIYSSSDDYSGASLTNPTVPTEYTNVIEAPVVLGRHVIVGSSSVILPGVSIGDGSAIGALSLIRRDCEPFSIYSGNPARRIGARQRNVLELEQQLLDVTTRKKPGHVAGN